MNPVRANRQAAHGNQLGDPAKAAEAVLSIAGRPDAPVHLVLGSDALRLVGGAREAVDAEIDGWAELSRTTDIPDGAQINS
jgi:hypothetical protein